MRALPLLVFLWVFPSAYQAFNIPLPNALLIHGEPVGFITPPHRARRAEKDKGTLPCKGHEYQPKKENFCCNKCLAGYRVVNDCLGDMQATNCTHCKPGTYTDIPNRAKFCEACAYCLPQYGQIELSPCTAKNNTRCGCPPGQFKEYDGSVFTCQICSTCQNGTSVMTCHDDKDTICNCFHNFFWNHAERSCRPCSECHEPECKAHCPDPVQSRKPEESNGVLFTVFGVIALVIMAAVGSYVAYTYYDRKHSPSSDSEGSNGQTTICVQQEIEKYNLLAQSVDVKDNPYVLHQPTRQSTVASLPLPDITQGTAPPCLNSPQVQYTIIESIPIGRWKEFVRRLGLSNYMIEACEQDYRLHVRDAQYAMLQAWVAQEGCPTTKRDQLFNVLREINLGGCIEKIEACL